MGTGILICGLNGAGKSTLGKVLAEKLQFHFIDNEDLYFPKTDPNYIYAVSRTRTEVEELLMGEIKAHENFIFTSVKGDYGEVVRSSFRYIILINLPRETRIQRVNNRSFQKFGSRILPGGDLYEKEQHFLDFVKARSDNLVEEWVKSMECPVIRIDGMKSVEENVAYCLTKFAFYGVCKEYDENIDI